MRDEEREAAAAQVELEHFQQHGWWRVRDRSRGRGWGAEDRSIHRDGINARGRKAEDPYNPFEERDRSRFLQGVRRPGLEEDLTEIVIDSSANATASAEDPYAQDSEEDSDGGERTTGKVTHQRYTGRRERSRTALAREVERHFQTRDSPSRGAPIITAEEKAALDKVVLPMTPQQKLMAKIREQISSTFKSDAEKEKQKLEEKQTQQRLKEEEEEHQIESMRRHSGGRHKRSERSRSRERRRRRDFKKSRNSRSRSWSLDRKGRGGGARRRHSRSPGRRWNSRSRSRSISRSRSRSRSKSRSWSRSRQRSKSRSRYRSRGSERSRSRSRRSSPHRQRKRRHSERSRSRERTYRSRSREASSKRRRT